MNDYKRIIPCIYLKEEKAVAGFKDDTVISDNPVSLAAFYGENNADELIVFDLSKDDDAHEKALLLIREMVVSAGIPVIGAGNIKRMEDVKKLQSEIAKKSLNKKPQPKEKKKEFKVRNTGTAFGAALAKAFGDSSIPVDSASPKGASDKVPSLVAKVKDKKAMAEELGIGEITLLDILKELEKPARDPRDEMQKPILRTDVLEMKDLKEGMILKGTVRNVIDFGAFVDIGVHQDGLVHISQLSGKKFVKHPLEVVSVGDIVDVKVMSVDIKKQRIQLTMKL